MKSDIGVIGLAVMGQNLVLNLNDHGYVVSVFNRSAGKTSSFIETEAKDTQVQPFFSLEDFVSSLAKPRRILLMIKAGAPVDEFIAALIPLLDKGDIIIDGGNSFYLDSERRCAELKDKGILFVGAGISGGEEGARYGPAIMPGGNSDAISFIEPIFKNIAAKVDGVPCCRWIGSGGSGHYVKMVHNGIEYGDMQLIVEVYALMKGVFGMNNLEIADAFEKWNQGELKSYLIEITAHILRYREKDGSFLLDKILDVAGQKGTGSWTGIAALQYGVPASLITESVFARFLSSLKDERVLASQIFPSVNSSSKCIVNKDVIDEIGGALYASKIISYAQGFMLMREASESFSWNLDCGDIALIWRGGCIIRSAFLSNIKDAFTNKSDLPSLLLDGFFSQVLKDSLKSWRKMVALAITEGIPIPCLSSGLSFFEGYRTDSSTASLIQALRDYFGAHTYERTDSPKGKFYHTNWSSENP